MRISFVIATHRRPKSFKRLVRSLARLSRKPNEVIAVGNVQEDKYIDIASRIQYENVSVKTGIAKELGVNRARNLGVSLATGDVIVFIDDDCFFDRHQHAFLQKIEQFFETSAAVTILGGNYELPRKGSSAASKAYHIISQNWYLQGQLLGPSNWCLFGGCLAIRREAFEQGLYFDESIQFGGAESEFILRCLDKGLKTQTLRGLSVVHDCRLGAKDLIDKAIKQSSTTERFPVFQESRYRLSNVIDFKEQLATESFASPSERFGVFRMIKAYEANFLT